MTPLQLIGVPANAISTITGNVSVTAGDQVTAFVDPVSGGAFENVTVVLGFVFI